MLQIIVKRLIFIWLLLILNNCTLTQKIWGLNDYQENFKHFLVDPKDGFVVFLTENYHYVFSDNNNLIKNILFWQNRKILYIDSDNSIIKIEKNNKFSGDIVVRSFGKNLSFENKKFLYENGFKQNNEEWFLKLEIHGTRYLADENIKGYLPQLDLNYKIKIAQPLSLKSKFIAITLSPITISIDGVMAIGKILLFPFRD